MSLFIRIVALSALLVLGILTAMRAPRSEPVDAVIAVPADVPKTLKQRQKLFSGRGHVEDPPDWPFPISCDRVRWFAAHFSERTLDKMRIARGLPEPTAEQRIIGRRCIAASGK